MCLLLLNVRKELMIIKILCLLKYVCDVAGIGEIFPGQSALFLFWLRGLTPPMVTPVWQGKAEKTVWTLMSGKKLPVWICALWRAEVSGNQSTAVRAAELPRDPQHGAQGWGWVHVSVPTFISPMCCWGELAGDLWLRFFCVGNALQRLCRVCSVGGDRRLVSMVWWVDMFADVARRTWVASFLSTFLSCCPKPPGQGCVRGSQMEKFA